MARGRRKEPSPGSFDGEIRPKKRRVQIEEEDSATPPVQEEQEDQGPVSHPLLQPKTFLFTGNLKICLTKNR